jgi:hypothetical protein
MLDRARDRFWLRAEEAFADPDWRATPGHGVTVRASANAPDIHLAKFQRYHTHLVLDEAHHVFLPNSTCRPRITRRAGASPSYPCWKPRGCAYCFPAR